MKYDAVIIGAGIAGLTCALQLSRQGRKVLVLESQPVPGGFATSFRRNGFTFESSVHCVDSLEPQGDLRKFLDEFGVSSNIEYIDLPSFSRIIYPRHDFVITGIKDDLLRTLKEFFPAESDNFERLFHKIKRFENQFDWFVNSKMPEWLKTLLLPVACPLLVTASMSSLNKFVSRFVKDEPAAALVTDIWRFVGLPPAEASALYSLLVLRGYYFNKTCFIKGGFSKLFDAIIKQIKDNGSEVRFNSFVVKINTSSGLKVNSVLTNKSEEFITKSIISNANPIETLGVLVDNQEIRCFYIDRLNKLDKSISAVQVYLGLKSSARSLGMTHHMYSVNTSYNHDLNFEQSIKGDYENCPVSFVDHAQIDPQLAPENKGSLLIMILDSYSNWKGLDKEAYKAKKEKVAKILISRAQKYLPGLADAVEVLEVATPLTMQRYGVSPDGAIYGFAQTPEQSGMNRLDQTTKIKGLFLAGAWTRPGHGLHGCFVSGLEAADLADSYIKRCL